MILAFLCLVFLGTIIIGIPLVWAVLISTLLPMFLFGRTYPLEALYLNYIAGIEPNIYIAIPLFIVAGELINRGGVGVRIIRFVRTTLGWLPGGLGVCVVASGRLIFGGISGSAIADAAAVGAVMIPSMTQRGYPKPFAAALVAAAGTIGIIIPPSIPMLVFGFVGNVFGPGTLPFGFCAGYSLRRCHDGGSHLCRQDHRLRHGRRAVVVERDLDELYRLRAGPLHAGHHSCGDLFWRRDAHRGGGLAVIYGLFVSTVIYKDLSWRGIPSLLIDSFVTSAVVMVVIGTTQVLTWLITLEQMPTILLEWVKHLSGSPWAFLLLVNIALLILGHVLEPVPAILLTAPLFLPLAKAYGIDPVHLGLIVSCNLALGLFTPPIGATLFVASRIANVGVLAITRAMIPLFAVSLIALALVTYIPVIPMGLVWAFR